MEKKMWYVALTKKEDGRFIGIVNDVWYWSISRSSAVRVCRLMKTMKLRKTERYTSVSGRWLYWWF